MVALADRWFRRRGRGAPAHRSVGDGRDASHRRILRGKLLGRTWNGLADLPTAQEQKRSFFVSPELADPTIRVPLGAIFGSASDGVDWRWPLCLRTRHADHQTIAVYFERELTKLGEPNLRHSVRTDSVYRVLTSPSFSHVPIAFRLEVSTASGESTLSSAWLEDDGTKPDYTKITPAGYDAWWNASLPKRTTQRTLTVEQTSALQAVFADLPPYQMFNLDGIALAIESMHDGRRDARAAFLSLHRTQPVASSAPWRTNPGYRKRRSLMVM